MPERAPRPQDVRAIADEALRALDGAADLEQLEDVRVAYTGRRSPLAYIIRKISGLYRFSGG